ncbi:MAG TPA: helix-hairpin-helix domain-containing protein [Planctomycetota bacterium]|nr:helix-hairpin-helix domain-containing protein [Planctomycetota bacterium]
MPADVPSTGNRTRRLELLVVYALCVLLLGSLGVLWLRQKGFFTAEPVVEHTPDRRLAKPIELNAAEWWELTEIRGIGEVRAKAIIRWRDTYGGFDNLDHVREVPGIPDTVVDEMRDKVTVTPREKKR